MNKIYEKIKLMNMKKNIIRIIVIAVVFCVLAGVGTGVKFGSRIVEIENTMESAEHEKGSRTSDDNRSNQEEKWDDEDRDEEVEIDELMNFSTSDYITIGIILVIGLVILAVYWLLIVAYAIQKASKTGTNQMIWGLIVLFTNILGVIGLWIYLTIRTTCIECGMLQDKSANYCTHCGTARFKKCKTCDASVSVNDSFCKNCGVDLKQKEK